MSIFLQGIATVCVTFWNQPSKFWHHTLFKYKVKQLQKRKAGVKIMALIQQGGGVV